MPNKLLNTNFFSQIVDLLQSARSNVVRTINQTMVMTYFEIGRMIVEEEQGGKERAEYGKQLLKELSKVLTKEFGRGFSVENLTKMRYFYLTYSNSSTLLTNFTKPNTKLVSHVSTKSQALSVNFNLSWSHYLKLMLIDDEDNGKFDDIEATTDYWIVRELKREYDSALYTRLVLSRDKKKVKELSEIGLIIENPKDAVKDPYILEFIGLPEQSAYSENQLEEEIINKLEHFLLELGNGFTFVARQKRISFDDKHFWIDLVFYNRILKSFVLIDLKIGELKHQDIGQMQMYVNYYDREVRLEDENKTIGIVLCQNKSEAVVEYTLPENNEHIFASRYKTVLPSKEELKSLIKEQ